MQFTSFHFLIFFPMIVLGCYLLPEKWKKIGLLVFNYFFYICFGWLWAVLLQIITAITYLMGIAIEKSDKKNPHEIERKKILLGSISCIAILCVFKYGSLIIGKGLPSGSAAVFLPVGISFYLLQAVGYVIDVYKGKIAAEKNYISYSIFLSFFSTIQSGPIEKAEHFLPQLGKPRKFDYDNVKNGLLLMLWGYFEKLAVADLAGIFVDSIYTDYKMYSGWMIILATILYAFQLYADFDGYSNIAVGAAQALGFDLVHNFKQPYFADSIKEFWRRWHISLSNWLKEYVYIPLGGSRQGNRYMNVTITFAVSGIWHGEGLHYLVWGILHGGFQAVESVLTKCGKKKKRRKFGGAAEKLLRVTITFCLVDFAWLFFRAPDMKTALGMLNKIFQALGSITEIPADCIGTGITLLQIFFISMGLLCMLAVDVIHAYNWQIRERIARFPIGVRWGIYYCALLALLIILIANMGIDASSFIYGQF